MKVAEVRNEPVRLVFMERHSRDLRDVLCAGGKSDWMRAVEVTQ